MKNSLVSFAVFVGIAITVHLIYIGLIIPQAEQASMSALSAGQSVSRSLWVILRDAEQEICFIN